MMICSCTPLTSSHRLQSDHKWQNFCQIRHKNYTMIHPVFEICLFNASLARDLVWEPITEHYIKNEEITQFSIFVLICVQDIKKRVLASFWLNWKNRADPCIIFMPYLAKVLLFMVIFLLMWWCQRESTHISASCCFAKQVKIYFFNNLFESTKNLFPAGLAEKPSKGKLIHTFLKEEKFLFTSKH